MKIIYHCYGGSHSSVTAAAIHLGLLSADKIPSGDELKNIPFYDRQVGNDHGLLRYMGNDEHGNQVYIIGRRNSSRILENMYQGLLQIYGINQREVLTVNVMPYVNWRMVIGGFLSRKVGFIRLGRPIVGIGTRDAYLLLAGALSGGGCSRKEADRVGNTFLAVVIDIDQLRPGDSFYDDVNQLVAYVKSSALAPGFNEILVPGEPEIRQEGLRTKNGIEIDEETWRQITETAKRYGVPVVQ